MAFCSHCATEYVQDAKFCHKCGKEAARTVSNTSTIDVLAGNVSTASSPAGQSSQNPTISGTTGSSRLSFGAYHMKKEQECLSCSPQGSVGKKLKKTTSNNNTAAQVKVNVGIVTLRDGQLLPKVGSMLPLYVDNLVGSKELLDKTVEKHSRFNSQFQITQACISCCTVTLLKCKRLKPFLV